MEIKKSPAKQGVEFECQGIVNKAYESDVIHVQIKMEILGNQHLADVLKSFAMLSRRFYLEFLQGDKSF